MSSPGVSRDDLSLLLFDWEYRMSKDPDHDGWAHKGPTTLQPVSRDLHSTLFLINNHTDDPEADFKSFCRRVNQGGRLGGKKQIHLTIKPREVDEATNRHEKRVELGLTDQPGGSIVVVLEGYMSVGREIQDMDPNVGNYIVLTAKTMEGIRTVTVLHKCAPHGYAAVIPHNKVEVSLSDGLELVVTTGLGPKGSSEACCSKGLSTLFLLQQNKRDLARCHLSYRDDSADPSIGPTIKSLSIHRSARGRGLLPLLWHWVRTYVEENFTLETMSNDCEPGHCMIKASGLTNADIEVRDSSSVTDKEFFYQHAGFSVRQQESALGAMLRRRGRPSDTEGVLYIPLLSREAIAQRATSPFIAFRAPWPEVTGSRCCSNCEVKRPCSSFLRCARCKSAFYCNRTCQKRNWKRHKQWCGKTPTEVRKLLIDMGLIVDVRYASVTSVQN